LFQLDSDLCLSVPVLSFSQNFFRCSGRAVCPNVKTYIELTRVDKHLSRLQAHAHLLTTNPDDLEQQHRHSLSKASNLLYEARQLQAKATELEQQVDMASNYIKDIAVDMSDIKKTYAAIQYLDSLPQSCAGDIILLQNLYQQLAAEYK
jgi:DNA repair exonuclease SbcCD ATPase subunit